MTNHWYPITVARVGAVVSREEGDARREARMIAPTADAGRALKSVDFFNQSKTSGLSM